MTRTSQQECRGILEKVRGGNRIKAEKKTLSEEGVFFYVSKEKGIHWICFIAGKYSVWYNHGSLASVCGVERLLYGKEKQRIKSG